MIHDHVLAVDPAVFSCVAVAFAVVAGVVLGGDDWSMEVVRVGGAALRGGTIGKLEVFMVLLS